MDALKKKILHVEDDRSIVVLVKAVLEKAGYAVWSALDGMQAVMMARQVQPDLVILDVMIPAGGGAGVYERLRSLNMTLDTPILIYSAVAPEEIQKKIPLDARTTLLSKPAPPAEIVSAVKAILGPV
jgi:DNA-binding response OmpR family regulator